MDFNKDVFVKPVIDANKKLTSKLNSKTVYLYNTYTFKLIAKNNRHMDLIKELNI